MLKQNQSVDFKLLKSEEMEIAANCQFKYKSKLAEPTEKVLMEKLFTSGTMDDFKQEVRRILDLNYFKMPPPDAFKEGGIFSYIRLPMYKCNRVPEELLRFIFGENFKIFKINFTALKDALNRYER